MPAVERRRWQVLFALTLPLWAVSFALLLWASTSARVIAPGKITWQGLVDVLAALAVCVLSFVVVAKAQPLLDDQVRRTSYGIATVVPAVTLVLLWLFADRLRFEILLPGLAWRLYLALTVLPAALALFRRAVLRAA